ncbi:hypothetical protein KR222_008757 [Zaprionus bogoriensis]|nr:hypothetical protein KR222_008757 [Zaprionus bogoriensis]
MLLGRGLLHYYLKYRRKTFQTFYQYGKRCNGTSQSPKVLFFGTDNFSLPSLQKLHKNNFDIGVVTSFKSPANCIRSYAEAQKLPLHRWPISADHCMPYDLGVVVSFGHLIPLHIINAFPSGIINVHASLLPRWRGAAPIIYAIMKGDTKTGVSIMKVQPHHFDIGAILAQREFPIGSDTHLPDLHSALSQLGADLLVDTMNNLQEKLSQAQPQDDSLASYAPKITSGITEIVWADQNATELYARHRALYGFKSLSTSFLGKQVQLIEVRLPEKPLQKRLAPGYFFFHRARKSLVIGCAQNTALEARRIRIEGKKPMSAHDFNNGFLNRAPTLQFKENTQIAC